MNSLSNSERLSKKVRQSDKGLLQSAFSLFIRRSSVSQERRRTAFSLLPTAFSLLIALFFASCKSTIVPPDNWPPGPDTTSHEFTWQIDTIGAQGVLYDVAIVNDTLIYAVGEIFLRDSAGQIDPQAYNVAVWNGQDWTISRATNVPLRAVFAFSADDIWAGSSAPYHWDGSTWTGYNVTGIFGGYINKIWGSSSDDLYIVGTNGSIAHFNGTSWQKIESGTTLDIWDVWGGSGINGIQILAVASMGFDFGIFSIAQNTVTALPDSGIEEKIVSVWFVPDKKYYVAGSGTYRKNVLSDSLWVGYPLELTQYFTHSVSGTDTNDVFITGAFGDFLHYNGSSWKQFPELFMSDGSYYALHSSGRVVAAAGHVGSRAIALIGHHQ